jgi:hypothetical protein
VRDLRPLARALAAPAAGAVVVLGRISPGTLTSPARIAEGGALAGGLVFAAMRPRR